MNESESGFRFQGAQEVREDESESQKNENLVFYYNRAHRLEKAPQIVKDYYSGKFGAKQPGIFKSLVANKGNRFMLFSLAICVAVVIFTSVLNKSNQAVLKSIPVSLEAFSFSETVYVSVIFDELSAKAKQDSEIASKVNAEIFCVNSDNQICDSKIFDELYRGDKIYMRTTFPDYDIISVKAKIQIADESKELSVSVKKR